MNTVDDRFSNEYYVVEDTTRPVILDLSDLNEEQHLNVEDLQEVVEVAEAVEVAEPGAKLLVRRLSLTTLIIDLAVLVARKLSLKAR